MTLEIDVERVADVTNRLLRHRATMEAIEAHLAELGRRMHLAAEVAPAVSMSGLLGNQFALTAYVMTAIAERATAADGRSVGHERVSLAGGSVVCSAIQLASPIPSRPSTSGATGAIDAAGVARDAASLVDAGPATIAGRAVPLATIAATLADVALCRLRVGSGAAISTRTIVDERGRQVYEGSRSQHKHQADNGEPLDPDLERRDRQMWRVEHATQLGYLTEPYPGYPAYEVNAPRE